MERTRKEDLSVLCEKWRRNKSINPRTGRKINIGGPTYNDLERECRRVGRPTYKDPVDDFVRQVRVPGYNYDDPRVPGYNYNAPADEVKRVRFPANLDYAPRLSRVCQQWFLDKSINPRTGRQIKIGGPIYRDLERECNDSGVPRVPQVPRVPENLDYAPRLSRVCQQWLLNKSINPRTGRQIKIGGPIYRDLERECKPAAARAPPRPVREVRDEPVRERVRDEPVRDPDREQLFRERIRERVRERRERVRDAPPVPAPRRRPAGRPPDPVGPRPFRNVPVAPIPAPRKINKAAKPAESQDLVSSREQSWFSKRLDKGFRINTSLRAINADQWDMCMTGDNAKEFRKNFLNVAEIGKGSFGQVYRATIKTGNTSEELVIKEAYLKPDEKRVLKMGTKQNQKWDEIEKNSYPRENRILELVNQLLLRRRCPNFVYVYNMAMCDGCKVQRLFDKRKATLGSCYVTFMESARTDLHRSKLTNFDAQQSVLYQLLIAVHAIHRYYGIWHRDIKTSNVLVDTIKPGGYFEYVIGNKTYYVKNAGVVAYIADFGVADVLSPLYSFTHCYGRRNAEVVKSSKEIEGSYLYWKPIALPRNEQRPWRDADSTRPDPFTLPKIVAQGTVNYITGPEVRNIGPIDLNDTQRFPPFEFADDIQDVIRMFVGGRQAQQEGRHSQMNNLSPELADLIKRKKAYIAQRDDLYRIYGTVKYVRADEMLEQLYLKPKSVDRVVDRFVM